MGIYFFFSETSGVKEGSPFLVDLCVLTQLESTKADPKRGFLYAAPVALSVLVNFNLQSANFSGNPFFSATSGAEESSPFPADLYMLTQLKNTKTDPKRVVLQAALVAVLQFRALSEKNGLMDQFFYPGSEQQRRRSDTRGVGEHDGDIQHDGDPTRWIHSA